MFTASHFSQDNNLFQKSHILRNSGYYLLKFFMLLMLLNISEQQIVIWDILFQIEIYCQEEMV